MSKRREHEPFTLTLPQPERHVHLSIDTDVQPVLLGSNARLAVKFGPCSICPATIVRGQRMADVPGGGTAHVTCLGRAAR